MEVQFLRWIFNRHSDTKFHENPSIWSRIQWGRTDMTNLIVDFRNFADVPKNVWRSSSLVRSCRDDKCENLAHELLFWSCRLVSSYGDCGNKHMGMSCRKPVFSLYEVRQVGQELWSLRLLLTHRNVWSEKNTQALHYTTSRDCFNVSFLVNFSLSLFLQNSEKSYPAQFPHYITFPYKNWIEKTK